MSSDPDQTPQPVDNSSTSFKVPTWFWIVAVVALLWNLMGLMMFFVQMTMSAEALSELPEDQQELFKTMPMWVNIAFGAAVVGGTLGSIGLVMRKRWAFPVFIISLLGVLAQQTYFYFLSDTVKIMGIGNMVPTMLVLVVAILLAIFSKKWISKGWLR